MPPLTRGSRVCQGSLLGSDTGFSYSGNVSILSFRNSLDDCMRQTKEHRMLVIDAVKRAELSPGRQTLLSGCFQGRV